MKKLSNNILGNESSLDRFKRKAPVVTAVIGFVCSDAIVLASDSQMTSGETKLSAQKIHSVKFADGNEAIFAFAGNLSGANLFVESFGILASKTNVDGPRKIADLAESAIKESRAKILDGFKHPSLSPEQCLENLREHYCELILAYYYASQPFIYHLRLDMAVAVKSDRDFMAIGSAANIAALTLTGFNLRSLPFHLGAAISVYTIEACKRGDLYCSGMSQAAWIFSGKEPSSEAVFCPPDNIIPLQDAANQIHREIQADLSQKIMLKYATIKGILVATAPPPPSGLYHAVQTLIEQPPSQAHPSNHPAYPGQLPPDSSAGGKA